MVTTTNRCPSPAAWHDRVAADSEFLVAYDYGMGGLWRILIAPSAEAIVEKYPEIDIVNDRPKWLTEERYQQLRSRPLRLEDDPPQGVLSVVVADRDATST